MQYLFALVAVIAAIVCLFQTNLTAIAAAILASSFAIASAIIVVVVHKSEN